jgi:hypothetical protein
MSAKAQVLDIAAREHLAKLLGMLGSDHAGEIAAGGRKAHEFLKRHGLTWPDVLAVPSVTAAAQPQMPPWRAMLHACLAARAEFNDTERAFLQSMLSWHGHPTPKQMRWLVDLYEAVS